MVIVLKTILNGMIVNKCLATSQHEGKITFGFQQGMAFFKVN